MHSKVRWVPYNSPKGGFGIICIMIQKGVMGNYHNTPLPHILGVRGDHSHIGDDSKRWVEGNSHNASKGGLE